MRFYHDLASSMASGGGLPQGGLTFNPLYPVFLAVVFKIFGERPLAPRTIQCLSRASDDLADIPSARTACAPAPERWGPCKGDIAGVTAASLALLYPQLLLYEGSLLATSLVTLIMAASFYTALAISRLFAAAGR